MSSKGKETLEQYRTQKSLFEQIEEIAVEKISGAVKSSSVPVYGINHRIKAEKSLAGKLERKGDKYTSLSDITDILGIRVICYFSDDVDTVADSVEKLFDVDWKESIDKRKILDINSFGYLSVHYICSLRDDGSIPKELLNKRFEVQMCSLMQHVWAVMDHDLGYKTKFGVPRAVSRDFSRLAGLLEIADEHFMRIRDTVANYTEEVHTKIMNDDANDIRIDSVSLGEYMRYSRNMRSFLEQIAKLCNAEIYDDSAESYLEQFAWLKKETLGDLQKMLEEDAPLALQMAEETLGQMDLDIFSSTAALRFLCRAELVLKGYSREQAKEFFYISTKDASRAERYANEVILK